MQIAAIEKVAKQPTFDLNIEDNHNYFVGAKSEILVHNSGKDPSKVDRSAAYAARWAARNIVAAGLAKKAEIQLSYAIGYAKPTSIRVDTFGTAAAGLTEKQIAAAVGQVFDFSPAGILRDLQLTDPNGAGFNYEDTASYGHFGRSDANFPWEKENRVAALRDAVQGAA